MIQAQGYDLSDMTQAVCAANILLVPLAAAGLALTNAALGRSRSAAHALLGSLCVAGVAALAYAVCGFAWQGFAGGPERVVTVAGKPWGWIGAAPWLLGGVGAGGARGALVAWLGMFSAMIIALIPVGAGNGRWRLGPSCASAALLAGFLYPLFAHWVWGGGWLAQLGANAGLGWGVLDAGGSGTLQAVGGMTALAVAWILGPRRGKYSGAMPAALPGHNLLLTLFACFLLWLGWLGLNGSGSILFAGAAAGRLPLVAINTTLCAAAASLITAALTRIRFGRPDASLCANGWTGGLVASSAVCAFVSPTAAAFTGAAAGVLVTFAVEWLDVRFSVDDPAGAISVHGVGGLWGLVALGIFARFTPDYAINGLGAGGGFARQWVAQWIGVAALLVMVLPLAYGLNRLLNRFYPQRVSEDGDGQGMDLYELGAEAYPEFVTREDFRFK